MDKLAHTHYIRKKHKTQNKTSFPFNKLFFLSVFFLLVSCSSSKKIADYSNAPNWVKEHPVSQDYYIGIGVAQKTRNKDFREQAKKNAYAEISSEISVYISNNSILKQQETNGRLKEMYNNSLKTYSNNELKGSKKVARWENKTEYWVYYRLSKESVEKHRKKAVEDALLSLKQALKYDKENDYNRAISSYVLSLSAIKHHLGQRLKAELNGETIFIGQYILDSYRELISSVRLSYKKDKELMFTNQEMIEPLEITLTRNNVGLKNVPLKIFSTDFIYKGSFRSNEFGVVHLPPVKANTHKNTASISLSMDIDKMLEESGASDLVKELLKNFETTRLILNFESSLSNVEKPKKIGKTIFDGINKSIEFIETINKTFHGHTILKKLTNPVRKTNPIRVISRTNNTPIRANEIQELLSVLNNENYENDKLSSIANYLAFRQKKYTTSSLIKVASKFRFENNKLDFAKLAYKYAIDKENYYLMNSIFSFRFSREALNNFIKHYQTLGR